VPGTVNLNNNTTAYALNANIGGSAAVLKNGTGVVTLAGTNTYSGGTMVNAGVLLVTNGGTINSPNASLVVAGAGTNILAAGSSITVQSLVVVSNVNSSLQNAPYFSFNGGTLTNSNPNGVAANISLAANSTWTVNGNWSLNGGTNIFASDSTANGGGAVLVGNNTNNVVVSVNPNATWVHLQGAGFPAVSNNIGLYIGSNNAVNNQFVVNGGTVIVTNSIVGSVGGTTASILVGYGNSAVSNLFLITNGGLVISRNRGDGGAPAGMINAGNNNSIYVGGTNAAGVPSIWNLNKDRLTIGSGPGSGGNGSNWIRVDAGGVITNCSPLLYQNFGSLFVTNGGQLAVMSGGSMVIGRGGASNTVVVSSPNNNAASIVLGGRRHLWHRPCRCQRQRLQQRFPD